MKKLFESIKRGLHDAITHSNGEKSKSRVIVIDPTPQPTKQKQPPGNKAK
jgi:hypothetical protein